ncbi:MAG: SPOR domain-containing protein [Nitrosomonadales bacterium]|nr:SPOR domain-containing protein [Nitrosomonadales bacterium]
MGRNAGNKPSAAPRKSGSSIWSGVLVGMMVGVGLAAGVAWYLLKSPKPFVSKEPVAKLQPEPARPNPPPAPVEKPAAGDGKQRFEFYKVLTDKDTPARPAEKPSASKAHQAESKPVAAYDAQILQAGSFSNVNDAEKLKAKLALLGVEASIQTATIPDKGVWYRVRLGPYKTADALNHTRGFLKQNGVDSTPMRAQ